MSNKSIAISPLTMPAALAAADGLLGSLTWAADPGNPDQVAWLETFRQRAGLAREMPEIRRNATQSAEDHVAWLKHEGWDAQITQGGPNDIFLAATINIVAKWREAGRAYKDSAVDRVLLEKGATVAHLGSNAHPMVMVATQNPGFAFLFQQLDRAPRDTAELADRVLDLASRRAYGEVHLDFPMVDLKVRDDARYMIGLRSGPNVITQAAEQLRLELNEIGGRASAAAEVAVSRGFSRTDTVRIEGPFVVAVTRLGADNDADRVAFAAYVDRDAWRKPAEGRI